MAKVPSGNLIEFNVNNEECNRFVITGVGKLLHDDWNNLLFIRPMGQIEQWARGAPQARPVYLFHVVKIGRTEIEAST